MKTLIPEYITVNTEQSWQEVQCFYAQPLYEIRSICKPMYLPLWDPGINHKQPLSFVQSCSGIHIPRALSGSVYKYVESLCGSTVCHLKNTSSEGRSTIMELFTWSRRHKFYVFGKNILLKLTFWIWILFFIISIYR